MIPKCCSCFYLWYIFCFAPLWQQCHSRQSRQHCLWGRIMTRPWVMRTNTWTRQERSCEQDKLSKCKRNALPKLCALLNELLKLSIETKKKQKNIKKKTTARDILLLCVPLCFSFMKFSHLSCSVWGNLPEKGAPSAVVFTSLCIQKLFKVKTLYSG